MTVKKEKIEEKSEIKKLLGVKKYKVNNEELGNNQESKSNDANAK